VEKNKKSKKIKGICSEVLVTVREVRDVCPGEEKERIRREGFAEKGFKPVVKEKYFIVDLLTDRQTQLPQHYRAMPSSRTLTPNKNDAVCAQ